MTLPAFTPREVEVLDALRSGAKSYREIAAALDPPISPVTARLHTQSIARKIAGLPGLDGPPLMAAQACALTRDYAPAEEPAS